MKRRTLRRSLVVAFSVGALAGLAARVWKERTPEPALSAGPPTRSRVPPGPAALAAALVLLAIAVGTGAFWYARSRSAEAWAAAVARGDPARAPGLMIANGCAGCHTIPGVPGARGAVGPSLTGLADRAYIAGILPNTPDDLVRWIRASRAVNPRTAMPTTDVSEQDARDMAAYLYAQPSRP